MEDSDDSHYQQSCRSQGSFVAEPSLLYLAEKAPSRTNFYKNIYAIEHMETGRVVSSEAKCWLISHLQNKNRKYVAYNLFNVVSSRIIAASERNEKGRIEICGKDNHSVRQSQITRLFAESWILSTWNRTDYCRKTTLWVAHNRMTKITAKSMKRKMNLFIEKKKMIVAGAWPVKDKKTELAFNNMIQNERQRQKRNLLPLVKTVSHTPLKHEDTPYIVGCSGSIRQIVQGVFWLHSLFGSLEIFRDVVIQYQSLICWKNVVESINSWETSQNVIRVVNEYCVETLNFRTYYREDTSVKHSRSVTKNIGNWAFYSGMQMRSYTLDAVGRIYHKVYVRI